MKGNKSGNGRLLARVKGFGNDFHDLAGHRPSDRKVYVAAVLRVLFHCPLTDPLMSFENSNPAVAPAPRCVSTFSRVSLPAL